MCFTKKYQHFLKKVINSLNSKILRFVGCMDLHIKRKCVLLLSIKTSSQMITLASVFKNFDAELKPMVHVDKTCSRFTICGTLSRNTVRMRVSQTCVSVCSTIKVE
jgi:hypothetical protein